MSLAHASAAHSEVFERYLSRIEAHLVRLREGHDPMGHYFGIERLARAARAEWWEDRRRSEHRRHGP